MKVAIESIIHEMEVKLGGYVSLLMYRYANLCVKADPMSLLSTIVEDEEQGDMTIEQVAGVLMPDEYHLKLVPFDPRFNFTLCKAIAKEHPEFKQELVMSGEGAEEDERYLILTMPEVNKERHDVLVEGVNVLYDGCKAQMVKTSAHYRAKLVPKLQICPDEERQEAEEALESSVNTHTELIDKQKTDKLKEIEEAYQRYLDDQAAKKAQEDEIEATRVNRSSNSMKMGSYEE